MEIIIKSKVDVIQYRGGVPDSIYIHLKDEPADTDHLLKTIRFPSQCLADYDSTGALVGLEFLIALAQEPSGLRKGTRDQG